MEEERVTNWMYGLLPYTSASSLIQIGDQDVAYTPQGCHRRRWLKVIDSDSTNFDCRSAIFPQSDNVYRGKWRMENACHILHVREREENSATMEGSGNI